MHKLAELCIRRPVFASVLILALVVVGVFSYFQLGVDRFPNVDFPVVNVTTVLPGGAPEEIETEITDKIEAVINTISGIDELQSTSSEGISVVTVRFLLEKDGDIANQEVRDKVATILGDLPQDAEAPIVEKIDPDAEPVLYVALSGDAAGDATIRDITEFADKVLQRQLENISGVGQVLTIGGRERQINIVLDSQRLAALELTPADVVSTLRSQNVQLPGGRVEQGTRELTLRTHGRVRSPQEFAQLAIANRAGYTVRIGDVATVEDSEAAVESLASVAGHAGLVLQIRKQSGTNTIAVVERVKSRLSELETQLPEGWNLRIVRDQSDFILAAVHNVQEHLLLGSLLATLVVFVFLRRWRPTVISALAIPCSLIAAFGAVQYMGFTLNIITLLALTLAVGIVIDDAVIVLENIFRFMEEKKMKPREAAVAATKEIGLAVTASSLSLIAVFLPVAFMGGLVGRFMESFGVTMAFAIAVSLLVSFVLTPMMASRFLRHEDLEAQEQSKDTQSEATKSKERGIYPLIERTYLGLLRWSLRYRWVVVVCMILVFLSTGPLFKMANKNFLPLDDESQFSVTVRLAEGTSIGATQEVLEVMSERIRRLNGVETTVLTLGDDPQRTRNLGTIFVRLTDVEARELGQFEIMDEVRRRVLPQFDPLGVRAQISTIAAFGNANNAEVQFWLGGPDLEKLAEYSEVLLERLKSMPGAVDADTNLVVGKPELGVRIDRAKAADLGVRVQDIAATLNVLVGGLEASDYYEGGEQYEVHVRAEARDRDSAAALESVEVPSTRGGTGSGTVRLADVVDLEPGTGPSVIHRISRQRQVLLYANVLPGYSSQTLIDGLFQTVEDFDLPPGYSYGLTGRAREQGNAANAFLIAFTLAIIFMYLILAAQFESWIHPVTILLALPLTLPFALLSIVVLDQSVNIFSSLGILVLFGIVKKNGILQIDHMNGLRAAGRPRLEAILEANRDRLRPILMTTLSFVAGMIPLVVSSGTGAGTNRAIGSVIIGGQSLALALTLIATPVMYSIFDDWRGKRGREEEVRAEEEG